MLLPHPNLATAVDQWQLDPSWSIGDYSDPHLHDVFASAAVLLTDYSSMAFKAAYLDRPVVYYQFDRDRILSGGHVGRRGYFDYDEAGFGPVCFDADDVPSAIGDMLQPDGPPEPFRSRIRTTFPFRDGRCSERVVAAVE